jgi:glycosyltransferase involved in cell wall biosynthesis
VNSFVPPRLARSIGPKLYVLPPGVDHQQFRPLGVPRDESCVLFVAHIRPEKGLHVLVEAMSRLPRLRLEVLCTVSYEAAYFRRVRGDARRLLGDRVKFVLSPDRPTLIDAYNRASCVVVPSLGLESWNLVLLEAAACGTACVRTELPGLAWAEFAVPAPTGDAELTARAIERAIADRDELGARAKSAADEYSWERTCRETVAAYAGAGLAT